MHEPCLSQQNGYLRNAAGAWLVGAGRMGGHLSWLDPTTSRGYCRGLSPGVSCSEPEANTRGLCGCIACQEKRVGRFASRVRCKGERAVFHAAPGCNTVSIMNASHIVVQNLALEGHGVSVDAVKCEDHMAGIFVEG